MWFLNVALRKRLFQLVDSGLMKFRHSVLQANYVVQQVWIE